MVQQVRRTKTTDTSDTRTSAAAADGDSGVDSGCAVGWR